MENSSQSFGLLILHSGKRDAGRWTASASAEWTECIYQSHSTSATNTVLCTSRTSTCDWRSRVQSQPLHCRVQLWTSCSQTLSSASGVTTLWRYINQFKFFF